jgi:hypothetical protein
LAVDLALVVCIVRERLHRPVPPDRLLVPEHLARSVLASCEACRSRHPGRSSALRPGPRRGCGGRRTGTRLRDRPERGGGGTPDTARSIDQASAGTWGGSTRSSSGRRPGSVCQLRSSSSSSTRPAGCGRTAGWPTSR